MGIIGWQSFEKNIQSWKHGFLKRQKKYFGKIRWILQFNTALVLFVLICYKLMFILKKEPRDSVPQAFP